MKILICSKLFYPNNSIGAVRPSNFARYLNKFGHNVVIITEGIQNNEEKGFQDIEIIRTTNSKALKYIIRKTNNHIFSKNANRTLGESCTHFEPNRLDRSNLRFRTKKLYRTSRRQIYNLLIEIDWYLKARKILKKSYRKNAFDIVISSFGPYGSYLLGYYVAKSKIGKYWISDLRDNMPSILYPFWLNIIYKRSEKKMIHMADALTFVSYGQATMYCNSIQNLTYDKKKVRIIFNGYEKELIPIIKNRKDNILRISYTGQLYSNLRDLRLLFRVINDLVCEELIDPNRIIFYYAGQDGIEFKEQVMQFDRLKQICKDLGFVDRRTSLEIQELSDLLVVSTWNTDIDQGILTGKFQEYLQAYKPIISLTSGNLPNGELTEIVNELNLGIACEYVKFEESYLNLKGYIWAQYKQVQDGNPLIFEPNVAGIGLFHYEKLTQKLEKICFDLISNCHLSESLA